MQTVEVCGLILRFILTYTTVAALAESANMLSELFLLLLRNLHNAPAVVVTVAATFCVTVISHSAILFGASSPPIT